MEDLSGYDNTKDKFINHDFHVHHDSSTNSFVIGGDQAQELAQTYSPDLDQDPFVQKKESIFADPRAALRNFLFLKKYINSPV